LLSPVNPKTDAKKRDPITTGAILWLDDDENRAGLLLIKPRCFVIDNQLTSGDVHLADVGVFANVRFAPILLKKSKIESLRTSREGQFLLSPPLQASVGVPVANQIRTYWWWCNPPKIGRQRMYPVR
jgi:hypothetical protein